MSEKWTQCPPVTVKVKELIGGQVCMGTYRLVELEVMQLERELAEARAEIERLKINTRCDLDLLAADTVQMNKMQDEIEAIVFVKKKAVEEIVFLNQEIERKDKLIEQMREALDATDEYYLDKSYAGKAHNTPIVVKVREAQAALAAAERMGK
jgi:predicted  nucleic acid-binding Zn-ribbon protein